MKTAAIIAEFNPFHNGHALLIRKAKEELGADRVIVLMSGDFVQRGGPAAADRHVRAKCALLGGADLVLAYPSRYATSSAESFAFRAVDMLDRLHCVDLLVFGSECGDLELLTGAADRIGAEEEDYRERLREGLKKGLSFPKARAEALPEYRSLLRQPNNILAVEYLKALRRTGSTMQPATAAREGAGHHRPSPSGVYASAGALRRLLKEEPDSPQIRETVPEACLPPLLQETAAYGTAEADDWSLILLDRLWRAECAEELAAFEGVTEELANAMFRNRVFCRGFSGFADLLASRNLTRTAVCRAFLHLILGFRKDDGLTGAYCTQGLGFRKEAEELPGRIRENSTYPVLMNLSREAERLSGKERLLLEEELRVSHLYTSVRCLRSGAPFIGEYSRKIVKA